MEKKVSIITPCYNGERYVGRYVDSILSQTYPNIELILVNDGSHDDTERIVLSYKNRFADRGFNLIYIFQQNAGQAMALNVGLKVFTGDYLRWCDSDDFLDSQSIEKQVDFLERHEEYDFVRSDGYIYNEKNLSDPIGYLSKKKNNRFNEKIFDELILEETYCSCCYMVRTSVFLDVNPKKYIYPSRGGQNWQMILPVAFKYNCGYIDEPLYNYIVRQDSHYHSVVSKEDLLKRCYEHEDILKNVVNSMDIDKEYYNKIIIEKYLHKKMMFAGIYRDKVLAEDCHSKLKEMGCITNRDRKYYFMSKNIFMNIVIRELSKVRQVIFG